MYISWISFFYKDRLKSKLRYLNLFPLLPAVFDWLENSFEVMMTDSFMKMGKISQTVAETGSLLSQTKWLLSAINYVILALGIYMIIRAYIQSRSEKK